MGGVDAFAVESRLDEDAVRRLREISVDNRPIDTERSAEQILNDLVGWFELRRLAASEQEIRRRLHNPNEDHDALLAERHELLLQRRARLGGGTRITSADSKATHSETEDSRIDR